MKILKTRKVAITISGQTRSYNTEAKRHLKTFIDMMEDRGYDIDLYGIVWDDNEMPDNESDFVKIETRSQDDLRDFIRRHISEMGSMIISKKHDPDLSDSFIEYIDGLPTKTEKEIEFSVKRLAQVWGAFEAIQLIEDIEEYELIIRWRWDLGFYVKGVDSIIQKNDFNKTVLRSYFDGLNEVIEETEEDRESRSYILFMGYAKLFNAKNEMSQMYLEDQFMILNTIAAASIQTVDTLDLLRYHYSTLPYGQRLGEHTLWTQIWKSLARYLQMNDNIPSDWGEITLDADLPRFLSYQP